jgi:cysteinyl-tRNA synthetase, unknown class
MISPLPEYDSATWARLLDFRRTGRNREFQLHENSREGTLVTIARRTSMNGGRTLARTFRPRSLLLGCVWFLAPITGLRAESSPPPPDVRGPGRGFPATCPWISFYGNAHQLGDLNRVARTFRIINIDADPQAENFRAQDIALLKDGGRNRVLSYLNLGACERYRQYWDRAPTGYLSCKANRKAQRGIYRGYPDETWMDPSDEDYQRLLVEVVAPRLAATGVDGFFLDNLEIVEHRTDFREAACDARCKQGGLALVARLRAAFPNHLLVMQNATGELMREARLPDGARFVGLLDGVSREEVYTPVVEKEAEADLLAWQALRLSPGGRHFFIGTEDYVGKCRASKRARIIRQLARARGFCPYVTDASSGQKVVCSWAFRP